LQTLDINKLECECEYGHEPFSVKVSRLSVACQTRFLVRNSASEKGQTTFRILDQMQSFYEIELSALSLYSEVRMLLISGNVNQ
jgi:hypothetical protein